MREQREALSDGRSGYVHTIAVPGSPFRLKAEQAEKAEKARTAEQAETAEKAEPE